MCTNNRLHLYCQECSNQLRIDMPIRHYNGLRLCEKCWQAKIDQQLKEKPQ